jgi:hypothetical protein
VRCGPHVARRAGSAAARHALLPAAAAFRAGVNEGRYYDAILPNTFRFRRRSSAPCVRCRRIFWPTFCSRSRHSAREAAAATDRSTLACRRVVALSVGATWSSGSGADLPIAVVSRHFSKPAPPPPTRRRPVATARQRSVPPACWAERSRAEGRHRGGRLAMVRCCATPGSRRTRRPDHRGTARDPVCVAARRSTCWADRCRR